MRSPRSLRVFAPRRGPRRCTIRSRPSRRERTAPRRVDRMERARRDGAARYVDPLRYRTKAGSLAISGNSNLAEHGGWERRVEGVAAGGMVSICRHITASRRCRAESWQVVARLDWRDARAASAWGCRTTYTGRRREGDWTKVWSETQAPEKAASVVVQLYLSNAPQGTVWWDDISLDQIPDPGRGGERGLDQSAAARRRSRPRRTCGCSSRRSRRRSRRRRT